MPADPTNLTTPSRRSTLAFSVTELLVVIAIIAILVTLLLVALGGATDKARETKTLSLMNEFAKACDAFMLDHGRYPGPVPETAILNTSPVTSTELALLELMGGVRVFHPSLARDPDSSYANYAEDQEITLGNDWAVKIRLADIGVGPVIDGKPYAPYMAVRDGEFVAVKGQINNPLDDQNVDIPELVDAWGQPLVYLRQARRSGDLVSATGQFMPAGAEAYLLSTGLGEIGANQAIQSVLNTAPSFEDTLAQFIRNPAFGEFNTPQQGQTRGAVVIFSAGTDGVYFAIDDGPGSPGSEVTDLFSIPGANLQVVEEYDDPRTFTGSSS